MDLLTESWIPARNDGGIGSFKWLTYKELLCEIGDWQVGLPRDDLEMACIQLLVCMTQVMFLPKNDPELRTRIAKPLSIDEFEAGVVPYSEWFDLDHPTQPFMQSRGVNAIEITPIQKLLIGLPEGNNHAFFNEVGEVRRVSGTLAAIALFNQAINCPSFGGGFKGSLRGRSPVTTLVSGKNLRETIWRNVLTVDRIRERLPGWQPSINKDQPTWVRRIDDNETIVWNKIGLTRGLFWQPCQVELVKADESGECDVTGLKEGSLYSGFRKEKFNFKVEGLWPHPHGAMIAKTKKGVLEWKFAAFTTSAPAWTLLSEFVVPRDISADDAKEGCVPAGPVAQADALGEQRLNLLVGGYRTNQASVTERRHDLISLAKGWNDDKGRLGRLVEMGKEAKTALRGKLYFAVQGNKDKGLKGIGAAIHESGEKLFYARTESLIHETFSRDKTFKEWQVRKGDYADSLAGHCRSIFELLTDPYAMKPELIPIIAAARRSLNVDLTKLKEGK